MTDTPARSDRGRSTARSGRAAVQDPAAPTDHARRPAHATPTDDARRPAHATPTEGPQWRRVSEALDAVLTDAESTDAESTDPTRRGSTDRHALDPISVTAARRGAALDRACRDDLALRNEVRSLLEADRPDGFLEASADEFARPYLDGFEDPPGTRVGPYRLLEEIGRGGMGTIHLAERADGESGQRVALKLVPRAMATEEILARFLRERRILAGLEHPAIARLLDGGTADDGRPYFVMEHVEGVPITRYAGERCLDLEERLRLFVVVCRAVEYAHRNLVVHRDLKPSNVLVDAEGRVTLLDFGIARLLREGEDGSAEESGPGTLAGAKASPGTPAEEPAADGPVPFQTVAGAGLRMTPEYASPEQVRGETVTTAGDVYQLGLLLYELLTGRRAQRLESLTLKEVERVVCREEPDPPSMTVPPCPVATSAPADRRSRAHLKAAGPPRSRSPYRARPRLKGDLDAIAMRALRKRPERRYGSAAALAEDVRRHLEGELVAARAEVPPADPGGRIEGGVPRIGSEATSRPPRPPPPPREAA